MTKEEIKEESLKYDNKATYEPTHVHFYEGALWAKEEYDLIIDDLYVNLSYIENDSDEKVKQDIILIKEMISNLYKM